MKCVRTLYSCSQPDSSLVGSQSILRRSSVRASEHQNVLFFFLLFASFPSSRGSYQAPANHPFYTDQNGFFLNVSIDKKTKTRGKFLGKKNLTNHKPSSGTSLSSPWRRLYRRWDFIAFLLQRQPNRKPLRGSGKVRNPSLRCSG